MKLEFLFAPTSDLNASLASTATVSLQRGGREGGATVALSIPGTDVQLMLDASDPDAPFGPLFVVDNVDAFHATRPGTLTVIEEISEIPGGFMATYQDPGGVTIYVMDQSTDSAPQ